MRTLVVMNGESDWQQYLPGIEVERRRALGLRHD
jgi:hypothetical protein